MSSYPVISIVIPTYNEEENLKRLLSSISKTTYPKSKLEIIVVDDDSTDNSIKIAKSHDAKIISVKTHDIELNKGIGMHASTGEYIYWLDADMEICSKDYFEKLVYPLEKDPKLIGSFTNEFALDCNGPKPSSLLRFISYDALQRDPLYQFFSPSIKSTIVSTEKDYFRCRFLPGHIPPAGRTMYKKNMLYKTKVAKNKSFIDLESLEIVARKGFTNFAYVPNAKIRHYHAETLRLLVKKRLRNLERDYLPNIHEKHYTWFNSEKTSDVLKILAWIIWANLLLPETIRGIYKATKNRDIAFLWQPIVSIVTTDAILFGFLSQTSGRALSKKLIRRLLPV